MQSLFGCPPYDNSNGQRQHDFDYREKNGISKYGVDIRVTVFLVDRFEFLKFSFLGRKSLHNGHPGKMFLYKCVQLRYCIAYFKERAIDTFLEIVGSEDDDRKRDQSDQCERRVHP